MHVLQNARYVGHPWYMLLEFFPRAVPDQRQYRPRFSISGSNLTIVLYKGSIFISTLLQGY